MKTRKTRPAACGARKQANPTNRGFRTISHTPAPTLGDLVPKEFLLAFPASLDWHRYALAAFAAMLGASAGKQPGYKPVTAEQLAGAIVSSWVDLAMAKLPALDERLAEAWGITLPASVFEGE